MDEELPEILIKYIPNLEKAVNIFSKDSLYYYFNDFFNNEYKSIDVVNDYVDNYLANKPIGLENVYILSETVEYEKKDFSIYKSIYKNPYNVKENLLNQIFNNPFTFETNIDSFKNVVNYSHSLKIRTTIPSELIEETLQLYKTSLSESLFSKLNMIHVDINNFTIEFKDNDFDYINDIMCRFGKDIAHMTDEEYNKIPSYTDKKYKIIKNTIQPTKEIVFWKDDINKYITHALENYQDTDIISILNDLTNKNLNLPDTNIFGSMVDLYKNIADDNIEIDNVYQNINNYLKKLEIEYLIKIFLILKNNNNNEVYDVKEICNTIDKVFLNEYTFTHDLIEVIDNEDENDMNDNYMDYSNILNPNIDTETKIIENDEYTLEKRFIKEVGDDFNIKLHEMLKYMNCFKENEKIVSMIFYIYFTIQTMVYNNDNEFTLNKDCVDVFYEYEEPIKLEDNKKLNLPKNKSIYTYVMCCFKNISEKITEAEIEKKLTKMIINNESCKDELKKLQKLYDEIGKSLQKTDIQFYKNLIINLKNADDNVKYISFVKALKYVAPKKLKNVNKFISGCCAQLLNQDYKAYGDIMSIKNDNFLIDIQNYRNKTIISYDNSWEALKYLPIEIIDNDITETHELQFDDEDDSNNNYNIEIDDIEINKYLLDQSLLNDYVTECVNSFMMYVTSKNEHFSLKTYILEKCKIVQNVKHLFLAGCLKDSSFFYDQIAILENSCCVDYDFSVKRNRMYVYLSATYLKHFNSEKNNDIYEKIKILSSKVVLSREEYNKAISSYREKLKVDAINILESLTADDKEVAMMLKQNGIIKSYDDYMDNPVNTNKDHVVNYQGDDDNDKPLY
jgi:hypothetical protein